MSDTLAELFPDGDYRFHLTLRRGQPGEFFRPRDHSGYVLAERVHWLDADPDRYARLLPEGEAAVREFAAMASAWLRSSGKSALAPASALQVLHLLGRTSDADVLFLSADQEG